MWPLASPETGLNPVADDSKSLGVASKFLFPLTLPSFARLNQADRCTGGAPEECALQCVRFLPLTWRPQACSRPPAVDPAPRWLGSL